MVPRDNCQEVGIREVCSSDDVDGVFEILRTGDPRPRATGAAGSRATSSVSSPATSSRWPRSSATSPSATAKGLSAGEKRMLQRSRQILVSELVLACHCDEGKTILLVDEALES